MSTDPIAHAATDPNNDGRNQLPGPVLAFWEIDGGETFWFPDKLRFPIGRQVRDGLYIGHQTVSRYHAFADVFVDRVKLTDVGSTYGLFRDDLDLRVPSLELFPGDRCRLGKVRLVALNAAMAQRLPDFTNLVGERKVIRRLLEVRPHDHVVLYGADTAPLPTLAGLHHHAITAGSTPFIPHQGVPDRVAEDEVLRVAVQGRLFIDGRAPKDEEAPRFTNRFLDRLADGSQRTALTVALLDAEHLDGALGRRDPQQIYIPSVDVRFRDEAETGRLIDAVFFKHGQPWRRLGLHPDFLAALRTFKWLGDHDELSDFLGFVGRIWQGFSEREAERRLDRGKIRRHLAAMGFSMERVRALRPE